MKKNQGISLISLIITIIVIIILAAIVIFQGFSSISSSQLATFDSNCDNIYNAVLNKHGELVSEYALNNKTRNSEQIYAYIATNKDPDQYGAMDASDDPKGSESNKTDVKEGVITVGDPCQRIVPDSNLLKLTLASVREKNDAWFVTKDGQIFNASGFVYTDGNGNTRTYFNAKVYVDGQCPALDATEANRSKLASRAIEIAKMLIEGKEGGIGTVKEADGSIEFKSE